jgi:hypothetical protein
VGCAASRGLTLACELYRIFALYCCPHILYIYSLYYFLYYYIYTPYITSYTTIYIFILFILLFILSILSLYTLFYYFYYLYSLFYHSTFYYIILCSILLFLLLMLSVGIHALINVHEYHCIAIRMRCWLMDALFFYSLLQR